MDLHLPLFSTALIFALLSGSDATAAVVVRGTLFATVGLNNAFAITLKKKSGKVVTQVKSGKWTIIVDDKSKNHNFHLTGPGNVNKTTTRAEIIKTTWTVTLGVGTYNYVCDPHASTMKGSFKVVAG